MAGEREEARRAEVVELEEERRRKEGKTEDESRSNSEAALDVGFSPMLEKQFLCSQLIHMHVLE